METTSRLVFREDAKLQPEHAFRVDRKLDQNNLTYGSIYKQHVSKYRQLSIRSCIGVEPRTLQNFMEKEKHKKLFSRYCDKQILRAIQKKNSVLLKPMSSTKPSQLLDSEAEFIPLDVPLIDIPVESIPLPSQDRPIGDKVALGIIDVATQMYVEGRPSNIIGENLTAVEGISAELASKVAAYNRRLREDPGNVNLWLEFLKFQDILFLDVEKGKEMGSRRALLEKKIAIIDRALETVPKSVTLYTAKLKVGAELWEKEKLLKV